MKPNLAIYLVFVVRFESLNSALNANATLFLFRIKPVSDQPILDPITPTKKAITQINR